MQDHVMEDAYFYSEEPEDVAGHEEHDEQPIEEQPIEEQVIEEPPIEENNTNDESTEATEEATDIPPTEAPTEAPTDAPTDAPTESPDSPVFSSQASSVAVPSERNSMPLDSPVCSYQGSQNSNPPALHSGRIFGVRVADSITDAARYPLRLERFFHEHDLMVPKDKDLDSIEANEKSWTMVRPSSPSVSDGISWTFVDLCSGLSSELLKVCHFFDVMNGMSNHHAWNGFVVPTTDISGDGQGRNLRLKYNRKEVIGVIDSKHVESAYNLSLGSHGRRGVNTAKLLQASEMNSAGTQETLLSLFKIQLSFTAAFFKADQPNAENDDEDGEPKQATFGVATITSLRNVDALKLIVVKLIQNIVILVPRINYLMFLFLFFRTAFWHRPRRAPPTSKACTSGSASCWSSSSTSSSTKRTVFWTTIPGSDREISSPIPTDGLASTRSATRRWSRSKCASSWRSASTTHARSA